MKTRVKVKLQSLKALTALLALMALMTIQTVQAQVTVGAESDPAATLDVVASAPNDASTPEGVIVPRLTKAQLNAKKNAYTAAQTGATVYITDYSAASIAGYSDQIGCIGFACWDGTKWITNCEISTYVKVTAQPKSFTFYETGSGTATPLVFNVLGSSAITYQWYIITGSNVHVRIAQPCTSANGTGFNTNSFTPAVIKGTTYNAANTGFYRYYCVAKNQTGDVVESNIAEVAVGCGAKDINGEWISFLCHNLGANAQTIAAQHSTVITSAVNPDVANAFLRSANERTVYGDLYQWGRMADGHENRNKISLNGTGGIDATDNCVVWNITTPPAYANGNILGTENQAYPWQQVATTSTAYYGKFIKAIAGNDYNWYTGTGTTQGNADLLWRESAFGPNDPCRKVTTAGAVPSGNVTAWYPPSSTSIEAGSSGTGWRIPTQYELGSIFRGGTSSGSNTTALANTWVWYSGGTKGFDVRPDGTTTTLFLPASGYRNTTNALLLFSGVYGYYWSGTTSGALACYLYFYSSTVDPSRNNYRGRGMALRCVKE
ncbi:MAG: fibrobacter succinogenes major paralogous domain-containing protein [Candidatus Azobacteroides sp.]|nr:fibrobacter succinogenes major paralogous domain-containing protein [Candidatus Azobacteroides sp.]